MSEFIIYILLLSLWNVVLFYGKSLGISVILFIIPLLLFIYNLLKKNNKINNKKGLLFMIPIVLLSVTYFMYDSFTFGVLNRLVIFILFILMYIFTIKPTYEISRIFVDGVTLVFEPIAFIGKFFKEVSNSLSGKIKLSDTTKKVLKSLLIVLPIVIIVLVLLSNADQIFNNLFSGLFNKIEDLFKYKLFNNLFGKLISMVFIFILIGIDSVYLVQKYGNEEDKKKEKTRKVDLFTVKLLVSILNVIYVIFDFIQIKSLMLHQVMPGFNYANYARQGFFELLIVSIINITIILVSKKMENKANKKDFIFINIMNLIMVILTLIIIVSSFMRMNMYEAAYGYTVLRLFVYIALITEAILMIPTVMYIFNSNVNIVKSYMIIIISIYTLINFVNFDSVIAERNINRYYKDNKLDIYYLENASNDNLPLLLDLYNNCKDEKIKNELNNYLFYMKKDKIKSIFEFNLSKYKAQKLLKNTKIEYIDNYNTRDFIDYYEDYD